MDIKDSTDSARDTFASNGRSWLAGIREEYVGQWVALGDGVIFASGPDARTVYEAARAIGAETPFLIYCEPPGLPFAGW